MSILRKYIRQKLVEQATGKGSLIVVDIQPEYESGATFDIGDMLRAAAGYDEVLFLYNGADTLGMIDENGLRNYYLEKLDYDEETFDELMSVAEFFDKGYGFFRDVMDSGICFDRGSVVKIVKYMIDNNVQDIRDLDEEDVQSVGVSELLFDDLEDYGFWVPELQDVLPRWNGSDIAGGARNECLAEVEIVAAAQGLSFNQVDQFIYEGGVRYTESVLTEVDLGDKVFAKRAPEGHPHHGEEEDTDIEGMLWSAFSNWIRSNNAEYLGNAEIQGAIRQAADDPRYNDIIRLGAGTGKVYRGLRIADWDVEKLTGLDGNGFWQAMKTTSKNKPFKPMSDLANIDHELQPWGPVKSGLTSWSKDMHAARRFASQQQDSRSTREVGVLLVAEPSDGEFIDMQGLYGYDGLSRVQSEAEVVSIGPVRVTGVYFFQPDRKRYWH